MGKRGPKPKLKFDQKELQQKFEKNKMHKPKSKQEPISRKIINYRAGLHSEIQYYTTTVQHCCFDNCYNQACYKISRNNERIFVCEHHFKNNCKRVD